MKPPILMAFPESFETQRLSIRSPLPGELGIDRRTGDLIIAMARSTEAAG